MYLFVRFFSAVCLLCGIRWFEFLIVSQISAENYQFMSFSFFFLSTRQPTWKLNCLQWHFQVEKGVESDRNQVRPYAVVDVMDNGLRTFADQQHQELICVLAQGQTRTEKNLWAGWVSEWCCWSATVLNPSHPSWFLPCIYKHATEDNTHSFPDAIIVSFIRKPTWCLHYLLNYIILSRTFSLVNKVRDVAQLWDYDTLLIFSFFHFSFFIYAHDLEVCILGHQCYAQIWTKRISKLHARENARATLRPNKEIF